MESSLKRVLDYKVVFDCLADSSNGMIKLETLTARWPHSTPSKQSGIQALKLPSGCVEEWKESADDNGYLDWDKFSAGLEKALKAGSSSTPDIKGKEVSTRQTKAEQTLQSLRESMKGDSNAPATISLVPLVNVAEIEKFLASCSGASLAMALTRTRKEVYQCQLSLHRLTSPANSAVAVKDSTASKTASEPPKEPDQNNTPFVGAGNEKEELIKGIELLERTQQWFSGRLNQISLEGSSKRLNAKDLLAALEKGGKGENEALRSIQEINMHLSAVAQASLLLEQHRPSSAGGSSSRAQRRLSSDPGPIIFSPQTQSGPSSRVPAGGAPPTSTVPMQFQAYSSNTQRPNNRRSPMRSVSLNEVRNTGVLPSRPSVSYRGDGGGSGSNTRPMNIGTNIHSHQPSGGSSKTHHKPRRAHSFSYKESDSSPSSSNTNSQSSMTLDHPRSRPHSPHTHQYPLRETTSLRDVQSASNREQYSSQSQRQSSSQYGYNYNAPPTRSSSVRNIPTSLYYPGSERSSQQHHQQPSLTSPGHKQNFLGAKPLYGSAMAMTARVESVDIPDQGFEMPPSSYPTPGVRSGSSRGSGDTAKRTSKHLFKKSKDNFQNGTAAPRQHLSNSMLSIV